MRQTPDPRAPLDAFTTASDGVFAVDQQMHVVFWNEAAQRIFGLRAEEALGRHCDEIVGGFETSGSVLCMPDCRVIGCARRGRAAESYDLRRAGAGGAAQWLNVSIVVLAGARRADTLTVHLVRDVTSRRGMEQRAGEVLAELRGPDAGSAYAITKREAEVLRLLACGATNQGIAEALGISPTTVRNHIEHLLGKLGAHSKLEAVVLAARGGLV